ADYANDANGPHRIPDVTNRIKSGRPIRVIASSAAQILVAALPRCVSVVSFRNRRASAAPSRAAEYMRKAGPDDASAHRIQRRNIARPGKCRTGIRPDV